MSVRDAQAPEDESPDHCLCPQTSSYLHAEQIMPHILRSMSDALRLGTGTRVFQETLVEKCLLFQVSGMFGIFI